MWNSRSKLAIYPHLAKEALMTDHCCIHFCGRQNSQDVPPKIIQSNTNLGSTFFKKLQM